ncbi:MAG: hypothetical protein R2759_17930 [Bacteroidales bacterium]
MASIRYTASPIYAAYQHIDFDKVGWIEYNAILPLCNTTGSESISSFIQQ